MGDLFFQPAPVIDRVVSTIAMTKHIGLVLTKRPAYARHYLSQPRQRRYQEHIWIGFSAEKSGMVRQALAAHSRAGP